MRKFAAIAVTPLFIASPALAASGPYFSLTNTNFVVLLSFLLFVGILLYLKVPSMLGGMLDKRAENISAELDEARNLRDEAQSILASYERKQKEVQEQSERIIAQARTEAEEAFEQAKVDLKATVQRRIKAAEDQIAQAEAGAVKEVRDRAISVATTVAQEVITKNMGAADSNKLIDSAIDEVAEKLH